MLGTLLVPQERLHVVLISSAYCRLKPYVALRVRGDQ
jgi:hypothetical protein